MSIKVKSWLGKLEDTKNINQLAGMFGLSDWDKLEDRNVDYFAELGSYAYDEALKEATEDGDAEEVAEEKAGKAREEAEMEASGELFHQWHNAVMSAVEPLFEVHGLTLTPKGKKTNHPYEYKIVPTNDWKEAASKIIGTINGVGYFEFGSLQDFLDSGPYTPREAVLSHLGHITSYPDVYGDLSPERSFERSFR